MDEIKNQLVKATAEQAKEYDELMNKVRAGKDDEATIARINELEQQYDWFNVEFVDPATGKKGMKDVADTVVAPALYDGFAEYRSYICSPHARVIAIKDNKYGIIAGDGSGKELCPFKYENIQSIPFTSLFLACWNGDMKHFGVIAVNGDVVCPNILTAYDDVFNDILPIGSDGKYGVIDIDTYQCVLPEYDDLDMDVEGDVVFYKDGQKGYVTEEGEFITVEQYENDDKYIDVSLVCTRLP